MDRSQQAKANFLEGYNCAQSVALAFCEDFGFTKEQMARLVSGYGGGVGRMRELCGALLGAVLVCNLHNGYTSPKDLDGKAAHYDRIQKLCGAFREEMGTCLCRELLGRPADGNPVPDKRDKAYYETRPCPRAVETAARLAQAYLDEHPAT